MPGVDRHYVAKILELLAELYREGTAIQWRMICPTRHGNQKLL
jgi:hypothetical protein